MSEEANLAAVVAQIRTVNAAAFSLGQLKSMTTLPAAYNEVHVFSLLPTALRADGVSSTERYAVLIRSVAREYVNAQRMRQFAKQALLYKTVTVNGVESGGLAPALGDEPIGPDDGWFSGTTELAYAINAS